MRLSEFEFTIKYKQGKSNGNADCLSRLSVENRENEQTVKLINIGRSQDPVILDNINLKEEQLKDPHLKPVIECISKGDSYNLYQDFVLMDGVLYHEATDKHTRRRYVVPYQLRQTLLRAHHDCELASHVGRDKTYESIVTKYYWSGLYVDVQNRRKGCKQCAIFKPNKPVRHGLLQPIETKYPFHTVALDIIGPLKMTARGYKYVLVMIDLFTSWVEAIPLKTLEAEETANGLFKEIITRHGCPTQILTDRGTQFTSGLFGEMCRKLKMRNLKISTHHAPSNGKVERFNRFLKQALATIIDPDQSNWDLLLDCVLFAYRTTVNTKVKEIPFYLLYGRDVVLPTDLAFNVEHDTYDTTEDKLDYKFDMVDRLTKAYRHLQEKKEVEMAKYKQYYDKNQKDIQFKIGDLVMVYWPAAKTGLSKKLLPSWRGPYKVTSQVTPVTYRVERGSKILPIHVQRLRLYTPYEATDIKIRESRV